MKLSFPQLSGHFSPIRVRADGVCTFVGSKQILSKEQEVYTLILLLAK